MKTRLSSLSVIALFAALGSSAAYAHEVSPPGEGTEMHWIEHLNDPKPAEAGTLRGAEGPIRIESSTSYCDPALQPYYSTLGRQSAAETGNCAINGSSRTTESRMDK